MPESIYTVGGTVQAGDGIYIARQADNYLLELCRSGSFAYVLTARQMGKSSMMIHTSELLANEGIASVIIDLTRIGTQVVADQWYLGLLTQMADDLSLKTDVLEWWTAHAHLSLTSRLVLFLERVLLIEVTSRIVVFIDEIDTTLNVPFADDFYAALRYIYNARATTSVLQRISFVLIGVATPNDLISDPSRTPFNIGQRVELTDFTLNEALPLAGGLNLPSEQALQTLGWVLKWTGGHPYLTQRLCSVLVAQKRETWPEADVDDTVAEIFFGEKSWQDHNLQFVRDMLTERAPNKVSVLSTYRDVRLGKPPVPDNEQSIPKSHLKLAGVVHREQANLAVRNLIYYRVFNPQWIKEHWPIEPRRRRRVLIGTSLGVGTVMVALVVGFITLSSGKVPIVNAPIRDVDLTVSNVRFAPPKPAPGQRVTVSMTLRNNGMDNSKEFKWAWFSDANQLTVPSITGAVDNLSPGATLNTKASFIIPWWGTYLTSAWVNYDSSVPETNFLNDFLVQTFTTSTDPFSIDFTALPDGTAIIESRDLSGNEFNGWGMGMKAIPDAACPNTVLKLAVQQTGNEIRTGIPAGLKDGCANLPVALTISPPQTVTSTTPESTLPPSASPTPQPEVILPLTVSLNFDAVAPGRYTLEVVNTDGKPIRSEGMDVDAIKLPQSSEQTLTVPLTGVALNKAEIVFHVPESGRTIIRRVVWSLTIEM